MKQLTIFDFLPQKRCAKCGRAKPADEFNFIDKAAGKRGTCCRDCLRDLNKHQRVQRKRNGKELAYYLKRKKSLRAFTLRKFHMSSQDYDRMLRAQGGVCAICGHPETARGCRGTLKDLAVDHCHKTGRVRGLLCANCNQGLGRFKDDSLLLERASRYLESRGTSEKTE